MSDIEKPYKKPYYYLQEDYNKLHLQVHRLIKEKNSNATLGYMANNSAEMCVVEDCKQ